MPRQVFYHWRELEEHRDGLWRHVEPAAQEMYIEASAQLMAEPSRFEAAMRRALTEWPKSCEAAMTTPSLNRRAFMGHAGCCIETGSPEDLTRLAWHRLSEPQQDLANAAADRVIEEWERSYVAPLVTAMPELWDA